MITRRRFIQGVATGAITAPFLSVPKLSVIENVPLFDSRHIPGWIRNSSSDWQSDFPYVEFFKKNSISNKSPHAPYYPLNIIHQNLYKSPDSVKRIGDHVDIFVMSAHLEDIHNLERIFLYKRYIHEAGLSYGCFTIPKESGGIPEVLANEDFLEMVDRLPCSIILVDAQAIEETVPILPLATSEDSNRDRILQAAICGLIEPVVTQSLIACDYADLKVVLEKNKLFAMGVGFLDLSDDAEVSAKEAISTIYNQVTLGSICINPIHSCWINVYCGSESNMNHYCEVSEAIGYRRHDDSYIFVNLSIDNGLDNYVMETCYLSLA